MTYCSSSNPRCSSASDVSEVAGGAGVTRIECTARELPADGAFLISRTKGTIARMSKPIMRNPSTNRNRASQWANRPGGL